MYIKGIISGGKGNNSLIDLSKFRYCESLYFAAATTTTAQSNIFKQFSSSQIYLKKTSELDYIQPAFVIILASTPTATTPYYYIITNINPETNAVVDNKLYYKFENYNWSIMDSGLITDTGLDYIHTATLSPSIATHASYNQTGGYYEYYITTDICIYGKLALTGAIFYDDYINEE